MNSILSSANEHSINSVSRKMIEVRGVTQMLGFDERCVILSTVCGELEIDGEGLTVDALDVERGYVSVHGDISGINYSTDKVKKKRRFWGSE